LDEAGLRTAQPIPRRYTLTLARIEVGEAAAAARTVATRVPDRDYIRNLT
jgi:hypothetical protein